MEMKDKPQEVVGKKRVAHEAKHLEVNVNVQTVNVHLIHMLDYLFVKSCAL